MEALSFLIIGAGSLGSGITNIITRMGAQDITVFDRDKLEPANIAPSFASRQHLGQPKVTALQDKLHTETGFKIKAVNDSFGQQMFDVDIVVISVDTMNMRRYIWDNHRINYELWIDARMGGDQAGVYTHVSGFPTDTYDKGIRREGAQLPCGEKATAPISAGLVPGMVGMIVMRYIHELPIPSEIFTKVLIEPVFFSSGPLYGEEIEALVPSKV